MHHADISVNYLCVMTFPFAFMNLGPQELILILVLVLVLFGAKKIPELARGLGQGMKEFKKATDDIKKEINDHSGNVVEDLNEMKDTFKDIK